jgi:hypothetical protein
VRDALVRVLAVVLVDARDLVCHFSLRRVGEGRLPASLLLSDAPDCFRGHRLSAGRPHPIFLPRPTA